eukprot:m.352984 g.352984  ORF g.352984 m.352984 type:complete len:215 (-) comp27990_c0_seq1:113-757(-)
MDVTCMHIVPSLRGPDPPSYTCIVGLVDARLVTFVFASGALDPAASIAETTIELCKCTGLDSGLDADLAPCSLVVDTTAAAAPVLHVGLRSGHLVSFGWNPGRMAATSTQPQSVIRCGSAPVSLVQGETMCIGALDQPVVIVGGSSGSGRVAATPIDFQGAKFCAIYDEDAVSLLRVTRYAMRRPPCQWRQANDTSSLVEILRTENDEVRRGLR